ncbi:MAG: type II secretion system protein GspG, partial [Planctomycetia bacterium]|nr:type II secretion system protein GspG [Planctomycetia bacterium]
MKRVAGYSSRNAFTLLELLIVLAILIVIIGMLATTVWGQYKKALVRITTNQVKTVQNAVEQFKIEIGRYPTQQEGLYALVGKVDPNAQQQQQQNQQTDQNGQPGMTDAGMGGMGGDMTGMGGYGQGVGMGGDMSGAGMGTGGNGMGMGMDSTGMYGGAGMGGDMNGMYGGAGMDSTGMYGGAGMGGDMSGMYGGSGMDSTGMYGGTGMGGDMGGMGGYGQPGSMTGNPQVPQTPRPPKITEPFIDEKQLVDSWKNPYRYEYPTTKGDGLRPAIWSCGPDGIDDNGDGDDIISWDPEDTSGVLRAQRLQYNNNGMNPNMNGGMTDMTGGMNPDMTGGMDMN